MNSRKLPQNTSLDPAATEPKSQNSFCPKTPERIFDLQQSERSTQPEDVCSQDDRDAAQIVSHHGTTLNKAIVVNNPPTDRQDGKNLFSKGQPAGAHHTISDYQSAISYLYGKINYERSSSLKYGPDHFRLDRMHRLAELLGNPHLHYPIVHVAGTKGKGTVCQLLADSLNACGYRTGLYTSPHLLELEERFQIGPRRPTSGEMVELVTDLQTAAEKIEAEGFDHPTFFELTTALGFLYFARNSVDFVVLEVGLGGRLDSTNICQPVACVITSIGLDHQKQLGNSIASIATEKAGIIKAGVPVICSARHPEARKVIEDRAGMLNSPLLMLGRDFSTDWQSSQRGPSPGPAKQNSKTCSDKHPACGPETASITFRQTSQTRQSEGTIERVKSVWETRLLGSHQADNIAAAVATLDLLNRSSWNLPVDACKAAVASAQPPGRLELVGNHPPRIIDTAHNPESIQAGLQALREHFAGSELTVIFASSKDKDYRGMLRALLPAAKHLILTSYHRNPRRLPASRLFQAANEVFLRLQENDMPEDFCQSDIASAKYTSAGRKHSAAQIYQADVPSEAWDLALSCTAQSSGVVYATGSFFLAAELFALGTKSLQKPLATTPLPARNASKGADGST